MAENNVRRRQWSLRRVQDRAATSVLRNNSRERSDRSEGTRARRDSDDSAWRSKLSEWLHTRASVQLLYKLIYNTLVFVDLLTTISKQSLITNLT